MLRVEVQNFQSVLDASIDIDGYVALVGKSNIGKSAIVRAMQCALTGAVGTDFVRHGPACDRRVRQTKKCKCFCRVSIQTSAMTLVWEKGDAVNRYTVTRDGKTVPYDGLDRGTPEFLQGDFSLVSVGDEKELIQVPDQFDPIFLLNQTGATVANVMSDVARLDEVNEALTAVNKDRKDSVSKRKIREEDTARLKVELAAYDGLDAISVDAVEEAQSKLVQVQEDLVRQERFLEEARALKEVLLALKAATAVKAPDPAALTDRHQALTQIVRFEAEVEALGPAIRALEVGVAAPLPEVDPLNSKTEELEDITRFALELSRLGPDVEALEQAIEPSLPNLDALAPKYALALKADGFVSTLSTLAGPLKRLNGVDKLRVPDDSELRARFEELSRVEGLTFRLDSAQKGVDRWGLIPELPELDLSGLDNLRARMAQVGEMQDRLEALQTVIADLTDRHRLSTGEVQQAETELHELGVCPTCSQEIGSGHRLHLEAS